MKSKIILFGLIGLTIILFCSCQKDDNSFENGINQNGAKLKRVLEYNLDGTELIGIEAEYEYDEENRISKVSTPKLGEDGEIVGTWDYDLYSYNSQGQLTMIERFVANINSPTGFLNLKTYIYTYSDDGKIIKEEIGIEYSLYKYDSDKLTRIEKYDGSDNLVSYIINEYDDSGNLIKETFYWDDKPVDYKQHLYQNGLNVQTDVFAYLTYKVHLREILKTYDTKGNLIFLKSHELSSISNQYSYMWVYEYFEE